jgi:hypothetical protein
MAPPADKPVLPPAILAALGLAACTGNQPCLKLAPTGDTYGPCLTPSQTDTYGPCLDYPPPTGETGDTGLPDTGATDTGTSETGDTGAATASPAALFQRIEAAQVLPADVLERLKKRGG